MSDRVDDPQARIAIRFVKQWNIEVDQAPVRDDWYGPFPESPEAIRQMAEDWRAYIVSEIERRRRDAELYEALRMKLSPKFDLHPPDQVADTEAPK